MFKTITVLGIALDVEYSTYRDANDNGVGEAGTHITIESVKLHDCDADIQDLLGNYVCERIDAEIMHIQTFGG